MDENRSDFATQLGYRDGEAKLRGAEEYAAQACFETFPDWIRQEIQQAFVRGCVCSTEIDAAALPELIGTIPRELLDEILEARLREMTAEEVLQMLVRARAWAL